MIFKKIQTISHKQISEINNTLSVINYEGNILFNAILEMDELYLSIFIKQEIDKLKATINDYEVIEKLSDTEIFKVCEAIMFFEAFLLIQKKYNN